MEETVELDMYGFVFHFLPQYVYSLSPKDRSHLDDSIFMELHCPAAFDLELHKIEKGDFLFRVLTFDPPCFADMKVPMCVIVTSKDDAKLYGYFTLEKNEHFGYVTCEVDTEMHSLLNLPRWPTLPTMNSFVLAVGRMILVEKSDDKKSR